MHKHACSLCRWLSLSVSTRALTHTHALTRVRWAVPEEEEVLYPPLTYLRPLSVQSLSVSKSVDSEERVKGGQVVLVRPSFPS